MSADPPLDPRALGPLLTDASLLEVQAEPGGLSLWLDCLRSAPAGDPLPPVELRLMEPRAVAISYDGVAVDARPSEVRVPAAARVGGLTPWPLPGALELSLNSAHEDEDLALAAEVDWRLGQPAGYAEAPVRLRLAAAPRPEWPALAVHAWIGARGVVARSGGAPLSLARWQQEHEDWWVHWAAGWQDELALPGLDRGCAVPLRGGCPDLSYQPPRGPAFTTRDSSGCPVELLAPLKAWHEGHLARDWLRMAQAFPHLDRSLEAHAEEIRAECLGPGFGRWAYVQCVDGWWIEGARAQVVLRGVEHGLGCCGVEERPVRWRYALRGRSGGWSIHGFRVEDLAPSGCVRHGLAGG